MNLPQYWNSTIGRKQIVATTGLVLIGFLIGHLAGNLFIYGGPDLYNAYAKKLTGLRPGLYGVEMALLLIFLIHLYVTALIVWDNFKARGQRRYEVFRPVGQRSWSSILMSYTGTIIVVFVIWHLLDFTFVDHLGPQNLVHGQNLGLYGIVYNAFADPWHSGFYILAMIAVGMHLSHGVQSFCQTYGLISPRVQPTLVTVSHGMGILVAMAYSSIPLFILFQEYVFRRGA